MKVIYSKHYNINLGLLNYLHPFDGVKFQTIYNELKKNKGIEFVEPVDSVSMDIVDEFLSSIMQHRVRNKNGIFQALEVPRIPFISFSFLDRKILTPMRWGVAGTILGATQALENGGVYWNISGGYHHAMQQNMEGFCIYNDIGICHQQLVKSGLLAPDDKILIIDTDAHHGNGNAYTFMENKHVTLLDVYNAGIYPTSGYTRDRVDIPVPLPPGTDGQTYLRKYNDALGKLEDDYRLAFVVAGTDTLLSDKVGGLCLDIDDVAEREKLTLTALKQRGIPTVILGGGGYSKDSAKSVIRAISACAESNID
ncbi:histone deacetylase family protein [Agaribacter marinus]|uniref:Histone deacetylase n=1 Tax=Agaribacter marinus TaxID=1431249 RepID=A0AA37WGU0_9ALTE|nr:histone deacetylase [Agaribacter marinus]GLR69272.1 histone deacetylase [Agaribacter marinus]